MLKRILQITALLLCTCVMACKQKKTTPDGGDGYISVRQFLDDQWNTIHGQPFTFTRIINLNGTTDTSFVPLDDQLWKIIREPFDAADISSAKFMGKYNFSVAEDAVNGLINFNYEAKSPDEYTQKMIVIMDGFNHRVKSMYIETLRKNNIYYRSQKLNYIPGRSIMIQEFEKSTATPQKDLRVVYMLPSKYD